MKQIYTLVRPGFDYDESDSTFAAFLIEVEANAARDEIILLWNRVLKKVEEACGKEPEIDIFSIDGEMWRVYQEWCNKRQEIINEFADKWPFNSWSQYKYDFGRDVPERFIEVRAIPLYSTPETA